MSKKLLILGYVCFYPKVDTLDIFARLLQCLLKGEDSISGYSLSCEGKRNFKKKYAKFTDLSSIFADDNFSETNAIVVHGKFGLKMGSESAEKINFEFIPSPLDVVWSKLNGIEIRKFSDPVQASLRGLMSNERFTIGRNIKEYPNIISIAIELEKIGVVTSDHLHMIGEKIACVMKGVERWSAILDAECFVPPFPTSESLTGNPDTVGVMDKFFLVHHLTIAGNETALSSYIDCIETSFPSVNLIKAISADGVVVSLKNWNDRSKIFLPKWHKIAIQNLGDTLTNQRC